MKKINSLANFGTHSKDKKYQRIIEMDMHDGNTNNYGYKGKLESQFHWTRYQGHQFYM